MRCLLLVVFFAVACSGNPAEPEVDLGYQATCAWTLPGESMSSATSVPGLTKEEAFDWALWLTRNVEAQSGTIQCEIKKLHGPTDHQ